MKEERGGREGGMTLFLKCETTIFLLSYRYMCVLWKPS